jgi:hypothetical protein
MASRVYLELNFSEERKINFLRSQNRGPFKLDCKIETRANKNLSVTPKDLNPVSPSRNSRKFFEVRRVSYQTIRTKHRTELPPSLPRPSSIKSQRNCSISPRKIKIKRFNSSKCDGLEELEAAPESVSKTYYNERIVRRKRKDRTLPLCIVNFNGVVGEVYRNGKNLDGENRIHMVDGSRSGLRMLFNEFFVVIVSWFGREDTRSLVRRMEEMGVDFDAVYIVRHRKLKYRFRHNYQQIVQDFGVKDSANDVLLLTSLVISRDEMIERRGADLFYESSLSGCNRFTSIGFPTVCDDLQFFPLCVVVPHCCSSEEKISFLELAKFIIAVKAKCIGQLVDADYDGEITLPCEHEDIPVIPRKPKAGQGIKYLVYTFCKSKKNRPPMLRKTSKFK